MHCSQSQQSVRGNLERLPLSDLEQFAAEQGYDSDGYNRAELISVLTEICSEGSDNGFE